MLLTCIIQIEILCVSIMLKHFGLKYYPVMTDNNILFCCLTLRCYSNMRLILRSLDLDIEMYVVLLYNMLMLQLQTIYTDIFCCCITLRRCRHELMLICVDNNVYDIQLRCFLAQVINVVMQQTLFFLRGTDWAWKVVDLSLWLINVFAQFIISRPRMQLIRAWS